MEVLIINAEGEEAEALIVVPALEDVGGEGLLMRGGKQFNLTRALHFRVRVKRVGSGRYRVEPQLGDVWGRPVVKPVVRPPVIEPWVPRPVPKPVVVRPPRPVVLPKPEVGRWGAQLKPAFKFCPYSYYAKLSPFRRVLCRKYEERWYQKRWQYQVRPKLYRSITQSYKEINKLLKGSTGVAFYPDAKSSILLAGFPVDRMNEENIKTLRELALKRGYLRANNVESQGIDVCFPISSTALRRLLTRLGFTIEGGPLAWITTITLDVALCLSDIISAINMFHGVASGLEVPSLEVALDTLRELYENCQDFDRLDPCVELLRQQDPQVAVAYDAIVDLVENFLAEAVFDINNPDLSEEERFGIRTDCRLLAERLLRDFLAGASSFDGIRQVYETFGYIAIAAIPWINNALDLDDLNDEATDSLGASLSYTDAWDLFLDLAAIWDDSSVPLSGDIAQAIYQFLQAAAADSPDIESLYYLQTRVKFARRAHDRGWKVERLNMYMGDVPGNTSLDRSDRRSYIDIIITGQYNKGDIVGYILLDAVKGEDDLEALLRRINDVIEWDSRSLERERRYKGNPVIIVNLYYLDPTLRDQLCQRIENQRQMWNEVARAFGVRIVIVVNGTVECTTDNTTPEEAQDLIDDMGISEQSEDAQGPTVLGTTVPRCSRSGITAQRVCL